MSRFGRSEIPWPRWMGLALILTAPACAHGAELHTFTDPIPVKTPGPNDLDRAVHSLNQGRLPHVSIELACIVDTSGVPTSCEDAGEASGASALLPEAVTLAQMTRFKPATFDGLPAPAYTLMWVEFGGPGGPVAFRVWRPPADDVDSAGAGTKPDRPTPLGPDDPLYVAQTYARLQELHVVGKRHAPVPPKPGPGVPAAPVEYYPGSARLRGLQGKALVQCHHDWPSGRYTDCQVVAETPANEGFGDKAKLLAETLLQTKTHSSSEPDEDKASGRSWYQIPFRFSVE